MSEINSRHIVQQPKFIFFIKIAQLVLSFLILILTAFAISVLPNTFGTFGFNIFCCLYTFIVCGYLIATPIWASNLWNCWAALVLEIFGVIFWLSGFATLAAWASLGMYTTGWGLRKRKYSSGSGSNSGSSYDYGNYGYTGISYIPSTWDTAWRCAAAAAGLGGLVWVLFMITLITYSVFLHRHRKENGDLPDDGRPAKPDAEKGVGHVEMQPVQQ